MLRTSLIIFIIASVVGCSSDSEYDHPIIGSWTLIKYCDLYSDPLCTGQPLDRRYDIAFHKNGSYSEDGYFMQCDGAWRLDSHVDQHGYMSIVLTPDQIDDSCHEQTRYVAMRGDTLILNPQCYEGCTFTYIRD